MKINLWKIKKYRKVRDHCDYTGEYRGDEHSTCNLKYIVPRKNCLAFHNGSNYDYHFIIKKVAEEFKKQFTWFGENIEKYITFTVPIEKNYKIIFYILQFIDRVRFIVSSLSNLFNNHSDEIHKVECKYGHNHRKC